MSYATTLPVILREKDAELHGRFSHIQDIVKPLLSYTQGKFPYYTPHDFFHSESVLENLNWIIPDKIKEEMNQYEIFLLLVAGLLHDWGMIGEADENPTVIRDEHHLRTERFFEQHYERVFLTYHEALIAGRIAKGHRKVDLYSSEYDDKLIGNGTRIRQRFLSALLRLADETDVTHSRTPEVIYFSINPSEKSEEEFAKHLAISGIGQLDEPHKIYITAIARDPKGAEAIRLVSQKVQTELNTVKSILSSCGITIDTIELKLETRGFIDKPIGFEVSSSRIVELLIGKHLYGSTNVAIRELVQNSIDSCCAKKISSGDYDAKIKIIKKDDSIVVIDNGKGMGFSEAKRFLSSVGDSIYTSDEYKALFDNNGIDPISRFGIGLLSSFIISDSLIIETKKDNEDSCLFTISSLGQPWKYEKGGMTSSGTKIVLKLNECGKEIDIEQSLKQYFITVSIPIIYETNDGQTRKYENEITVDEIYRRMSIYTSNEDKPKEIVRVDTPDYFAMLISGISYNPNQISLYSHDIFITNASANFLDHDYGIFINLKRNIVDLHISRENIIKNKKWEELLCSVMKSILEETRKSKCNDEYIKFVSDLFCGAAYDIRNNIEDSAVIRCFLENALLPIVVGDEIVYVQMADILQSNSINLIECTISTYMDVVYLVRNLKKQEKHVICPYRLPIIGDYDNDEGERYNLIEYLCAKKEIKYCGKDIRTILIENATIDNNSYDSICPNYVRFADFGEYKPLVVMYTIPVAKSGDTVLESSFWVGREYLWRLIDADRRKQYIAAMSDAFEEKIIITTEYIALIDKSDEFINQILHNTHKLSPEQAKLVQRYLQYLSIMPFAIERFDGGHIYLEVIDSLEKEISNIISVKRPLCIFDRMSPNCAIYLGNLGID